MSDVSTVFDVLASASRRRLLVTLCDVESIDVSSGRFTRSGTALEPAGGASCSGDGDGPAENALQLYHADLPKLEAEGVVEWDRERGRVSRGPRFGVYEPVVRLLATNDQVLPGPFC
ncbi:DUF7344 domain-containing protein [Halomarina oriensis]|uniref:DUF7344 domain-containing protein n=1 Tax=Halomarina oriensis TaxID=671145 RepID=A0A6B0GRM0_9EURY|nr:hypothetical protein [Halomarina oriensis]MWG34765.1 hypothetical protein [Halomarina oriensis]